MFFQVVEPGNVSSWKTIEKVDSGPEDTELVTVT
ncbi:uncharacterized, partial [Tachysurus ichikawai]